MGQQLIGRERELRLLQEYLDSERAEFIAVYGRRRVGKTFLVKRALGDRACFYLTGMENADLHDQLANFFFTLRRVFPEAKAPQSWLEAFDELQTYLERLGDCEKIIFIDELPWLDTVRSKFVGALERFWNGWADGRGDVKLVVCGSSTSWMIDNIINNRGGLHNRRTHQLYVAPFTLAETAAYFSAYGFSYREREIAECYMVMGGVAYYYSLMDTRQSVSQNIDRLFFSPDGELRNEFDNLYRSLFKRAGDHIAVVTALSTRNKGLTRKQIVELTKLSNNGKLTKTLAELEKCGFVRSYLPFDGSKRGMLYQLVDAYSLFHFNIVTSNRYHDPAYWTNSLRSARYNAWSGYAFEILCLNHLPQIKRALGIAGVQSRACCWSVAGSDGDVGAQIDLLIDRADQTVNVCEMKWSAGEYEITKAVDENVNKKLEVFLSRTGTRKSPVLTFVTSFGVKRNMYSGTVQAQVTLHDLMQP